MDAIVTGRFGSFWICGIAMSMSVNQNRLLGWAMLLSSSSLPRPRVFQYSIKQLDDYRRQGMLFNATFNNISVISWRSVLLVEETRVPREKHWPAASHCQTLSHNVVSGIRTRNVSCDRHWLHKHGYKSNYHTIMTTTTLTRIESKLGHNLIQTLLISLLLY